MRRRKGDIGLVEAYLVAGMSASYGNEIGMTPLMDAAAFGEPEVVQLLLRAGADVNLRDNEGKTALDHVITERNIFKHSEDIYNKVVEILTKAGQKGWG